MGIQVNFDLFDNKCFINYLNFLTGRIFKILPISESEPSTLSNYIESYGDVIVDYDTGCNRLADIFEELKELEETEE
jgi:hypothetical protein